MLTSSFLQSIATGIFSGNFYVGTHTSSTGTGIAALGDKSVASVCSIANGVVTSINPANPYFEEAVTATPISCLCVGTSPASANILYTLDFSTVTLQPGQLIKINAYDSSTSRGFRVAFTNAE